MVEPRTVTLWFDRGSRSTPRVGGDPDRRSRRPDGRRAFFGPVITELPHVEESSRLWNGVLLVTGVPGFLELET